MARTKSKARSQRARQQNNAEFAAGGDVDSFFFGDLNSFGQFPTAPTVYQKPRSPVFYATRNWFERNVWLKQINLLKFDMYNYGFKVGVAEDSKDAKKVEAWYAKNKAAVMSLVRDTWQEWLTMDNVVAVWCKGCQPIVKPTEHITYNDEFGIERLSFPHGLDTATIEGLLGMPKAQRAVLKVNSELQLVKQGRVTPDKLFFFEMVKRTRVGLGLAWPQLRTVFNTVAGWEAMELGDWQLAEAMKTVYELHQIGHEIKQGNQAGWPTHFLTKKRAEAVKKLVESKKNFIAMLKRLYVNFDHEISYPRPDPKHFGKERFGALLEKLMIWSMPFGQMLAAEQVNPWHGNFLQAKAATEREYIGPFLETILKEAMGAPDSIVISWSDDLFKDPRLMLDTLKTGLSAGPISQTTFQKKTGHSPTVERANKDEEHGLPEHQTFPLYDPAHGPGDGGEAGRPTGRPNSGRRQKA